MKAKLIFPRGRILPPDQPGYTRDTSDPYTFHLNYEPCQLRVISNRVLPCGKLKRIDYCTELESEIDPGICYKCDIRR